MPPILPNTSTTDLIDAAYVAKARDGDSMGVSMSQVIHPCDRAIWSAFRWAAPLEEATGQKQRIFETGNVYETRLLNMLRMIGCEVAEVDPATGKQFRVSLAGGHIRGKMDGIATNHPLAPATEFVVETKSSNDKNYKLIIKGPIQETKTEHFAQIQLYLHATGIRDGIYLCCNKNTDEIHTERITYDPAFCLAIIARIERIVALKVTPQKLYDDPTSKAARECNWCPSFGLCHEGAWARTNCRTCFAARVEDGPKWICDRHDRVLSYDDQQAGCPDHLYIPSLAPGTQIDADEDAGTITYRLDSGATWIDGGQS